MRKKKSLLTAALLGILVSAPITYSAVMASKTNDYNSFFRVNNFESINFNEFLYKTKPMPGIPPLRNEYSKMVIREENFRQSELSPINYSLYPDASSNQVKNNFGELQFISNQTMPTNIDGQDVYKKCDLLQNDIFTFCLFGNYQKVATVEKMKELLQSLSDTVQASASLQRSRYIQLSFIDDKNASSVRGNAQNGIVTISINSHDNSQRILEKIYYVTFHELMHIETAQGFGNGFKGHLLTDSIDTSLQADQEWKNMEKYGKLTGGRNISLLKNAESLHNNPFQSSTIPNVYIGNIPNYPFKTMAGNFDSEVTHLYTKPMEDIVEDILSFSIGNNWTSQLGSQYTGILGSLGYRIAHNVSLLSLGSERARVNLKILQTLFDAIGIRQAINNNSVHASNMLLTYGFKRSKLGIYSVSPIKIKNNLRVEITFKDGSPNETYQLPLKNFKTNVYMRTSPFGNEFISYHTNYSQIMIPTDKELSNVKITYIPDSSDVNVETLNSAIKNGIQQPQRYVGDLISSITSSFNKNIPTPRILAIPFKEAYNE